MKSQPERYRTTFIFILLLLCSTAGRPPTPVTSPDTFSYRIDETLQPALQTLPGLNGGAERTIVTVQEPDGVQTDFVADEVILYAPDPTALDNFIGTYNAEVLSGENLPDPPENLPPDKLRPDDATTDEYLLRVDLNLADTSEFTSWMAQLGFEGEYVFSSEDAVRLLAIVAKERTVNDLQLSFNPLMLPPPLDGVRSPIEAAVVHGAPERLVSPASADCVMCSTQEYTVSGGYADGFGFGWVNDADMQVTRAWQYYDLLEFTPSPQPVLAMVDFGFALNNDFPASASVPQYDFVTGSYTTNGNANTVPSGGQWHGTGTLGLAAARLNNQFGSAGTGGQAAFPYLFRPEGTLHGVGLAIYTAVYWGADVVNVSVAAEGGSLFEKLALWNAASYANKAGAIVLVTAGNAGKSTDHHQLLPCELPGFLCVGGVDLSTKQAAGNSNYGSHIDAWGPYNGLFTTPNPAYTGNALPGFGGTCGASAYMAGVVTMMRALSPTLNYAGAVGLLQSTANVSTDTKVSAAGYVNAYAAVKAAATSAGLQPKGDTYEPNDSPASAHAITPGNFDATIAPGDTDYFKFQTTDWVDLQLRVTYDDRRTPGNGLNARLDGQWGTDAGGVIVLDRALLTPGSHTLEIYGQSGDTINCYHVQYAQSASTLSPDAYDDEHPAGEPRNDTFAHRAILPGTVQASVLTPYGQIADLNFDTSGDIDFFQITLAPATDPQTGRTECLAPGDPSYGAEGFSQGRLVLSAWPDAWRTTVSGYNWPFEFTIYDASGSVYTSTTGLQLTLECPHQHFSDGKIRFSIRGQGGRRNFYRAFQHYSRWDVHYDVPTWIWTLTEPPLLRVIPPFTGRIARTFPSNPAVVQEWFAGTAPDPLPADYALFRWAEAGDLDVYLSAQGGHYMELALYDAQQRLIDGTSTGDVIRARARGMMDEAGHLHVPDLEAGTYALAFTGDFGTAYDVSIGPPYLVYLPVTLRKRP